MHVSKPWQWKTVILEGVLLRHGSPRSKSAFSSCVQARMMMAECTRQIRAAFWAIMPIAAYLFAPNACADKDLYC